MVRLHGGMGVPGARKIHSVPARSILAAAGLILSDDVPDRDMRGDRCQAGQHRTSHRQLHVTLRGARTVIPFAKPCVGNRLIKRGSLRNLGTSAILR
jgi:hypothetical protein